MPVRAYTRGDAAAMAELYQRSVLVLGAADYSAAQVAVWAAGGTEERFAARMADGRRAFVSTACDQKLRGFIDLEADGHIDFLYVAPEAKGDGTAQALLDAVEAVGRKAGMARLYAEASEAAKRFFTRRGFSVIRRRDFEVGGVPIHNYAVEKAL